MGARLLDLAQAAGSKTYCDDLRGRLSELGVVITELSTHLQGQLVATHPASTHCLMASRPPTNAGIHKPGSGGLSSSCCLRRRPREILVLRHMRPELLQPIAQLVPEQVVADHSIHADTAAELRELRCEDRG